MYRQAYCYLRDKPIRRGHSLSIIAKGLEDPEQPNFWVIYEEAKDRYEF